MLSIAIVIPTFNRSDWIESTLESIKLAEVPHGICFRVIVVNNNSTTSHGEKYKSLSTRYKNAFDIDYLFEKRQGRSHALNRGIAESSEEIIAFIDDDERIDAQWLSALASNFKDTTLDYLGGPYLPDWEGVPPPWLPAHIGQYQGLLGWIEQSKNRINFDDFRGELCGGNCAIRRSALPQGEAFNTALGRKGKDLAGGEDGEFHRRLKINKKCGFYDPSLIIYHRIPKTRMTYKYHLRWAFWSGISNGRRILSNPESKEETSHVFGIPRYWYKRAMSGVFSSLFQLIRFNFYKSPQGICAIMNTLYFCGFFYSTNIRK